MFFAEKPRFSLIDAVFVFCRYLWRNIVNDILLYTENLKGMRYEGRSMALAVACYDAV